MNNLVIVESPAKAKTIEKILGEEFVVKSSFGHIRDLPKGNNAIDVEHGFTPSYEISSDKTKVVAELRKAAKAADIVWLASDEDREGEAIAWHLEQTLSLKEEKTRRIVFHEITRDAILAAVENPRSIDRNLVDAQQARRILDRLVGFELSPLLWKKVKPSLSAGRVQSVVVKLLVEREREILNFKSVPYFRVTAEFKNAQGVVVKAELKNRFASQNEARAFLSSIAGSSFSIETITKSPLKRTPAAPFTTSTLQQEASRKLGFSVAQTMSTAQKLYEAGQITYMRTDSVNLSSLALGTAREAIVDNFGAKYHKLRQYTTKSKGAQEAHEAIRPTYIAKATAGSSPAEKRLYELIWKRAVASQMADAELEKTTAVIGISGSSEKFVATGEVIKFDGFLKLYIEGSDEASEEKEGVLPAMKEHESLSAATVLATERFTQSPARYSEASLVKKLEELGIGRPSTYAPTITTVITRGYVEKDSREGTPRSYTLLQLSGGKVTQITKSEKVGSESKKLFPTDIGMVVTDFLQSSFADVMDYNFTASVELKFDQIAEGAIGWQGMIGDFYKPFHSHIQASLEDTTFVNSERVIGQDPVSGKQITARVGRYGPMVQLGASEDKKFAKMQSGQLIETITLAQALKLFELPRTVGQFEDKDVVIGIGPFGPYVKHNSKFTSLKKGVDDPMEITLDRAVELIKEKREVELNRHIASYDGGVEVLRGRFGPYIACEGKNYKIPKTTDAEKLTAEDCRKIMETTTPTEPKKRTFGRKKK
ncbi:MAG: type I DNA topoisomerase [Mucinivorans sp.]